jgi:sigma-B regulation protein RsbU (phosphoserine phosphatase)
LAGIVTADVSLDRLTRIVSSIKVLRTGYAFLISKNGTVVTHPRQALIMNATLFGLAEMEQDLHLRAIAKRMVQGKSGFVTLKSSVFGEACRMYYAPVPSCGWSLAVIFPEAELVADITRLNRTVTALAAVGILLFAVAVVFIARSITRPLSEMVQATQEIGRGNLDVELQVLKTGDEAGRLSAAIEAMRLALKEYINRLTATTAVRERMESELKIARDIQMSTLPKVFPPFPLRKEFDLYALMQPAREVGGDFYDFFLIDETHLCLVIGDASGKGIPAALFMAMTKTLIKAVAAQGEPPGEILTRVNRELSQGNDSCMFVTLFLAVLCTGTGEVLYANGGHQFPLLVSRAGPLRPLQGARGLVVGALGESRYPTEQFRMEPGEALFLYTDGVTEALSEQGEMFSEERLGLAILESGGKSVEDTVRGVLQVIASFSVGAPQYDDITMMMLRFRGTTPWS